MSDKKDWKVSKRQMKKAKTFHLGGTNKSHHGAAHQKMSSKAEKRRYDAVYKASKRTEGKISLSGKQSGINEHMGGERARDIKPHELTAIIKQDLQRHIDAPRWKKIDKGLDRAGYKPKMFIGWASNVKNKTLMGVDFLPYGRIIASLMILVLIIILITVKLINN